MISELWAQARERTRKSKRRLAYNAEIIVQLYADGTYTVTKDRTGNFGPRDEEVFGIRSPELIVMASEHIIIDPVQTFR